ncbi:MAG: lipid-A-disaccharide synthase, partial [Thermoanaerobaculia bacterium]
MSAPRLLVAAGEASGEQRAARLLTALAARRPGLTAFGLGSGALAEAGVELVADSKEISVVGISEALEILPRAAEILRRLLAEAERRRPAAALLVDFPDFNLRLARELAWRGIPVVYYVSPQVWAWRRGRVRAIADCVTLMLVLFEFEVPFYRAHGVPVVHVGHPLVDEIPVLPQAWDGVRRGERPEPFRLALLPGSRRSEVEALLPVLLDAAGRIGAELPVEIALVEAPGLAPGLIDRHLRGAGIDVRRVTERRFEEVADSHLALCASGTATLEIGLLGTPMIVCYRLSAWTYALARALVRVPHVSLVNLVLGRRAVPELIQRDATPEGIAREAVALLGRRGAVESMRAD